MSHNLAMRFGLRAPKKPERPRWLREHQDREGHAARVRFWVSVDLGLIACPIDHRGNALEPPVWVYRDWRAEFRRREAEREARWAREDAEDAARDIAAGVAA